MRMRGFPAAAATAALTLTLVVPSLAGATVLGPQSVVCGTSARVAAHFANAQAAPDPVPASVFPCEHRTGAAAFEPTMGATADGTLFMQVARPGVQEAIPDVIRSTNGGLTWQIVSPTIAGQNAHQVTFDPVLFVDRDASPSRVLATDYLVACTMVSRTGDGETWATAPASCAETLFHHTIFAGPAASPGPPGSDARRVYICAVHGGGGQFSLVATCSKSLDGGVVFVPTGAPPFVTDPSTPAEDGNFGIPGYCDGMLGRGAVGPTGIVYLPKAWCGQPYLAISHDEGATWELKKVASNGVARTRDNRPDHEASVAVDALGNVYYTWAARNRKPYLAVCTNHGHDCGTPMMVGGPGVREVDRPQVAVGAPGKVAIAYVGSTNSPDPDPITGKFPGEGTCAPVPPCPSPSLYASATWNAYITVTTNALETQPLFFTATVNDPADPYHKGACGPGGCLTLGNGVSSVMVAPPTGGGVAWGAFFDACLDDCGPSGGPDPEPDAIAGRLAGISLA